MRTDAAVPLARTGLLGAVLAFGVWFAGPADAAEATAWAGSSQAEARLVDGGPAAGAPGARLAGLEIRLEPGAITYWRDPGDAGVPPVFDFAGSVNLGSAVVRYPAPRRLDEARTTAFGYAGDVTFPVAVMPADPARPVELHLDLAYAVCRDICLPARAKLSIVLDGTPSASASRVTEALAAVPQVVGLGDAAGPLAILKAMQGSTGDVAVEVRAPAGSSLFVEAASPFAFEAGTPAALPGGRLMFPVKRLAGPAGAAAPPLTLTLVAPGDPPRGIEALVQLDAAAKTP